MRAWILVSLVAVTGCVNRAYLGLDVVLQVTPQALSADGNTYASVSANVFSGGLPMPSSDHLTLVSTEPNATIIQFGPSDSTGWSYAKIASLVPGTQTLTVLVSNQYQTVALPSSVLVTFN